MKGYISRSQINSLLKSLITAGVKPEAVAFSHDINRLTAEMPFNVSIRDSDFFYTIEFLSTMREELYGTLRLPGASQSRRHESARFENWGLLKRDFEIWAMKIRSELDEPEPLLLIEQGNMLLGVIPPESFELEHFSERDQQRVHEFTAKVRTFLTSELSLTQQQLFVINERLCFLEESAKTQDKKAWRYTVVGVVFTIATGLTLSPEQGRKLFEFTAELLKIIFLRLLS